MGDLMAEFYTLLFFILLGTLPFLMAAFATWAGHVYARTTPSPQKPDSFIIQAVPMGIGLAPWFVLLVALSPFRDNLSAVPSALYVVIILALLGSWLAAGIWLSRFFKWKKQQEERATWSALKQETETINSITHPVFREMAQKHPELAAQLLLDSRTYQTPQLPDFLTPADTSAIDTLVKKYGEPFSQLANDVPDILRISDDVRFEHTWILGPQGSGKTQLMQFLLSKDLERRCSIVVIDSQGDLVRNVATLKSIQDRVILVEPGGVGINPFEMKGDHAVELLTYVFSALGEGAEFTAKQQTLYRYCIRLLQEIPGATLKTFVSILNGATYSEYVETLSEPAQEFFKQSGQFQQTKQELAWRLSLLLENSSFEKMFCSPTTLDLYQELNEPKIVVIDTSHEKLGNERSALMGRFFIALLLQVSQRRANLGRTERLPTFVYIDEAHEYLADDKVAQILDQARKMRIGMILANQRSAQIKNPNMLDALMTTSVKFVHTDNDRDTHLLARTLKVDDPAEIANLPRQTFGAFVRNETSRMMPVRVPFLTLENMEHVPLEPLRARMKERYGPEEVKAKDDDWH